MFNYTDFHIAVIAVQHKRIESLGSLDAIAPAVQKGNETVLNFINDEITALAEENFFHADYEATLRSVYGEAADGDSLVVEGGVIE